MPLPPRSPALFRPHARALPDPAKRRGTVLPRPRLPAAASSTGSRSACRCARPDRCASIRSIAAAAESPARVASRASLSAASAALRACSAAERHCSMSRKRRVARRSGTRHGLFEGGKLGGELRRGGSREAAVRPLPRPPPSATNPSHRRMRPSRVTRRWPTARDWPASSSATATCLSRRKQLRGCLHMIGKARVPAGRAGSVGQRLAPTATGAGCPRRSAASASSPSAAASARSYPGSALRLAMAAPLALVERAGERIMFGLRCGQAARAEASWLSAASRRSAAAARPCSASTRWASASASASAAAAAFASASA